MESLIKASEQYQALFRRRKLMLILKLWKKILCGIIVTFEESSLPNHQKDMIRKFYYDMKSRSSGKNFIIC